MATTIIPARPFGAKRTEPTKRGFAAAIAAAFRRNRQHEADAIAARYMAGRWTDAVEREINAEIIGRDRSSFF